MNSRLVSLLFVFSLVPTFVFGAETPENIARNASATAGSVHFESYSAQNAIDGIIPDRGGVIESNVWATNGPECGFASWFRLEWPQDVTVAEIIYYGRTIALEECFKDYDVYINVDSESMKTATPVFSGTLEKTRIPQRMTFPKPCQAKSVLIDFKSSYTSRINPGAAEIEVYPVPLSEEQLKLGAEKRTAREKKLAKDILDSEFGFKDILVVKRHHVFPSHVYTYHVEGYRPGGGLYVYTPDKNDVLEHPPQLRPLVDSSDGMILDADLSWDGRQVVFSWKQSGRFQKWTSMYEQKDVSRTSPHENYHLWKINIDGTGLTQLTHGDSNNLNPCWLPDGGIAFISDRKPAYAYCWCVTSPVLYRMEADGSQPKRLSSNYLMDFTPAVLNDGRIIFTRWEYVDRPAAPIQSLWTINPDGTNLAGYYGNRVLAPGTFMDTRAIPGSDKILVLATNHNGECTGGIVVLDRIRGSNAPEALLNTTPEVDIFNPGSQWGNGLYGPYEKPYPVNDGIYLVSRHGTVQVRTYENERATLLPESDGMGYYSAQPIRSRIIPPIVRGSTFDESVTLPEDGSASGSWATLFMQDVYNGLEPSVQRGTVKKIAIVQDVEKESHAPFTHIDDDGQFVINGVFSYQFPLVSCGATFSPKKVWGFADVYDDGSACFKVPSEVPISFLALDEEGRAVQRMRTFTHLMPGEVQGCVGCHSDRNFAVTSNRSQFLSDVNHPQELQIPEWGVKGFSYREIVQPLLDRHCVECHNAKDRPNGVDLSGDYTDFFSVSYEILARKGTYGESHYRWNGVPRDSRFEGVNPYTSWIWTTNGAEWNINEIEPYRWGSPASLLSTLIRTGHPDEEGQPRVQMSLNERKIINMWIDLNVPYYPTSTSNYPAELGCRRTYPKDLDAVLEDVASRRCLSCHEEKPPREFYTRVLAPEKNGFLLAPLAESEGGTGKCVLPDGKAVFSSKDDADYQRILKTFIPVQNMIKASPRGDMPDFIPPNSTSAR